MSKSMRPQNLKLALRADSGLAVGQYFPLLANRNIMGRRVDAQVPVDDSKVSRNHAAIDLQNGFYMIVDLGSTNGTYLNGRKLESSSFVNPGDEIRVGSAVFVVDLLDKAKSSAHKTWRDPTCVILPGGSDMPRKTKGKEAALAFPQIALRNPSKISIPSVAVSAADLDPVPAWRSVHQRLRLNERQAVYGRWLVLAVSLALTAAAIVLRMG